MHFKIYILSKNTFLEYKHYICYTEVLGKLSFKFIKHRLLVISHASYFNMRGKKLYVSLNIFCIKKYNLFLLRYCNFCYPTVSFIYHSHLSLAWWKSKQRSSARSEGTLSLVNWLLKQTIFYHPYVSDGALLSVVASIFCFMSGKLKSSINKELHFYFPVILHLL